MAEIPTPDLAVPYAAPKQVNTMADVQPMAPKKGCSVCQYVLLFLGLWRLGRRGQKAAAGMLQRREHTAYTGLWEQIVSINS